MKIIDLSLPIDDSLVETHDAKIERINIDLPLPLGPVNTINPGLNSSSASLKVKNSLR